MCYVDYVSMYYESFYTFLSGYFTLLLRLNKKDIPIFTLLQEIEKNRTIKTNVFLSDGAM